MQCIQCMYTCDTLAQRSIVMEHDHIRQVNNIIYTLGSSSLFHGFLPVLEGTVLYLIFLNENGNERTNQPWSSWTANLHNAATVHVCRFMYKICIYTYISIYIYISLNIYEHMRTLSYTCRFRIPTLLEGGDLRKCSLHFRLKNKGGGPQKCNITSSFFHLPVPTKM